MNLAVEHLHALHENYTNLINSYTAGATVNVCFGSDKAKSNSE